MTTFKAQKRILPFLEARPLSELCRDFVDGFCRLGDEKCPKIHSICRIDEGQTANTSPEILQKNNYLLDQPRTFDHGRAVFEDDGPGALSKIGMRHDNDYTDIRCCRILPTTDEILCLRRPWMPPKNFDQQHFLPPGPLRLIDTQFRQLRYDNTEKIIDACYHAMQQLARMFSHANQQDHQFRYETPRGVRYSLLRAVAFEELLFHESRGLLLRVSFDCPRILRGRRMHTSNLFEDGMLVALVGLNQISGDATTTFFEVFLRESTDAMKSRTGNDTRASIQLSFADKNDIESIRLISYYVHGLLQAKFVLVDIPNVLLPGFGYHLKQLQNLADSPGFAFAPHIAPQSIDAREPNPPPAYAAAEDFEYNLEDLWSSPNRPGPGGFVMLPSKIGDCISEKGRALEALKENTTLDAGQAVALVESLSHGLAFTQGPPGTGKTFLGVSLTQVILASQPKSDPRPVLAVCTTNHALDSFLGDLVKKGISKIARLGAASKEEWTKQYLLRTLTKAMKTTHIESTNIRKSWTQVENLAREGSGWCEALSNDIPGWSAIGDYLRTNHPIIYNHFATLETFDGSVANIRRARKATGFAYEYWSMGGDLQDIDQLLEVFNTVLGVNETASDREASDGYIKEQICADIKRNAMRATPPTEGNQIWSLSMDARRLLLSQWAAELDRFKICDAIVEVHRRHQLAMNRKSDAHSALDYRCLGQQQVIGLTTTACARYWPLLHKLNLRVVICEEAGEILEAHTLCNLWPSIQHAIFIGDPLQLRPHVSEVALSSENDTGRQYRLDESLFERLMFPSVAGASPADTAQLSVQRRMCPDIADISRATLYPYLLDHASTHMHPPVAGMKDRLYWLDHQHPEDRPDPASPMAKSYSNMFEVEMVFGLVNYLIKDSAYALGDIAILTPYNGQLSALAKRLRAACSVWLSEKDRESLIEQGLLSLEDGVAGTKTEINMANMLRLATIDNFQGEEAKVVILSTVRSNSDRRVGFLKTPNRINVACSRARDGFYVLGNAALMSNVEMWRTIVNVFRSKGKIGPSFQVCCTRHPTRMLDINEPEQFSSVPECLELCLEDLKCGHKCRHKCHPASLHELMPCAEPCEKSHDCGHNCTRSCGEPCGQCVYPLSPKLLRCGHQVSPTCTEVSAGSIIECHHPIDRATLPCGHYRDVLCSSTGQVFICQEPCGAPLECGHNCNEICARCRASTSHPTCGSLCGKVMACGHNCLAVCHLGVCPPCQQPCRRSCRHGACAQACNRICDPCVKMNDRGCEHQGFRSTMCCLPSGLLPCCERCTLVLPCGHQCPSLCNEICPTICDECTKSQIASQPQIGLPCGHNFNVRDLDILYDLIGLYRITAAGVVLSGEVMRPPPETPRCLRCDSSIDGVKRYAVINQVRALPDTIDRMYAKFGRKLDTFVSQTFLTEDLLSTTFESFCKKLRPGPLAGKHNQNLVYERGNSMADVQLRITNFRDEVVVPFESSIDQLKAFLANPMILNATSSPFKLRFDFLYHRCRLVTLEDAALLSRHIVKLGHTTQHSNALAQGLELLVKEQALDNIHALNSKITHCESLGLKRLEAELRLSQMCFHMLLKATSIDSGVNTSTSMKRFLLLCQKYPDTAGELYPSYRALLKYMDGGTAPKRLYDLYAGDTRGLWRDLGRHKIGALKYCKNNHPFSSTTFADCPECGREVDVLPPREPINYNNFLYEDAFLAAMMTKKM